MRQRRPVVGGKDSTNAAEYDSQLLAKKSAKIDRNCTRLLGMAGAGLALSYLLLMLFPDCLLRSHRCQNSVFYFNFEGTLGMICIYMSFSLSSQDVCTTVVFKIPLKTLFL